LPRGRCRCRGAAPASVSRRDQQRNRLHAPRIRVPGSAHTVWQFLVVWWPFLVLVLAVVLFARRVSFAGFLVTIFVALLVFSELVNAPDGLYLDDYIRFNPVLKWWGWIFTGGVFF